MIIGATSVFHIAREIWRLTDWLQSDWHRPVSTIRDYCERNTKRTGGEVMTAPPGASAAAAALLDVLLVVQGLREHREVHLPLEDGRA
jgi:hypothetical protein